MFATDICIQDPIEPINLAATHQEIYNDAMNTPVAFLIFNRPETTKLVFESIRKAKPKKLLVVADGSRQERAGESERCAATRAVIESVDWDCEVLKNYSDYNMGCGLRPASGLDWVFNTVEEAIILEDDCLPHPDFFRFCEEMLAHYRYDTRVMQVSGTNILLDWKSDIQSYHFTFSHHIWGWASWRRAWQYFDFKMPLWTKPEIKERVRDVIANELNFEVAARFFDEAYQGMDAWDYQWAFAKFIQSGLTITPAVNLVSNIGFGEDATHTTTDSENSVVANLSTSKLKFPLKIHGFVAPDRDFERSYFNKYWEQHSLRGRIKRKVNSLFKI